MELKEFDDIEIYKISVNLQRIGVEAVNLALKENRRLDIPNVFSHDNKIYYETNGGCISRISPFDKMKDKLKKAIENSQAYSFYVNNTVF
ncbi:MAG: hypothetical protein A2X12_02810 [Bacteroidetes bacterium GWE2_29_8]|nr:MAG: hypothetical protein A2X12_02810 [Bacteroidetes bacterium GWE2_29_8]OFY20105.1 MAG: hypothetical protein A2X02_07005 [Bacteroidetes bacterium GWF2_29_10]